VALLPQGILLILNQKECKRSVDSVGEVALAEGFESHVHHLFDAIIEVNANNGSSVQHYGIKWNLHLNLKCTQGVSLKQVTVVGRDRPVIAESDESTQELSWDPGWCRPVVQRKPSLP
jgi:hypothetical protein